MPELQREEREKVGGGAVRKCLLSRIFSGTYFVVPANALYMGLGTASTAVRKELLFILNRKLKVQINWKSRKKKN